MARPRGLRSARRVPTKDVASARGLEEIRIDLVPRGSVGEALTATPRLCLMSGRSRSACKASGKAPNVACMKHPRTSGLPGTLSISPRRACPPANDPDSRSPRGARAGGSLLARGPVRRSPDPAHGPSGSPHGLARNGAHAGDGSISRRRCPVADDTSRSRSCRAGIRRRPRSRTRSISMTWR